MMTIIAVDDEKLALKYLVRTINQAQPDCEIQSFTDPAKALEYLKHNSAELAFLDVEMYEMNGLELARQCKKLHPTINIIFVTGFRDYAVDAFAVHASGYLLKPTSVEKVREELAYLRNARSLPVQALHVHTFGNFEVFCNGIPVDFGRSKTKELFAYLVDRKGAGSTTSELCAVLWEDREYNISMQKQFQTIVSDLIKTLRRAGCEDIVVRKRNFLSVDTTRFSCDYYGFLSGDVTAINAYVGEYMSNYSWAEFTTGFLYQKSQR